MAREWPHLVDFDELVRLHREGKLDAYRDDINRQFVDQTPERSDRRHDVELLLFQMQAVQARSKNGLGASLRLSQMMLQKLDELGGFFCSQKKPAKQKSGRCEEAVGGGARILPFRHQEDS